MLSWKVLQMIDVFYSSTSTISNLFEKSTFFLPQLWEMDRNLSFDLSSTSLHSKSHCLCQTSALPCSASCPRYSSACRKVEISNLSIFFLQVKLAGLCICHCLGFQVFHELIRAAGPMWQLGQLCLCSSTPQSLFSFNNNCMSVSE